MYRLDTGKVIYTRDVRYLPNSFEHVKRVVNKDGDVAEEAAPVVCSGRATEASPPTWFASGL